MYAVIKTGGKQYRVSVGQILKVESLPAEEGSSVNFDEVLMVANGDAIQFGKPVIKDALVTAEVVDHGRGKKVHIIKFRRRKHSMKRRGHRQNFTTIKIVDIKS